MIIDEKGKLFGKISVLDIGVLLLIIVMIGGVFYKAASKETVQIVNSDKEFYVTFVVEKIRNFSIKAVKPGDVFYKQHEQIVGECVDTWSKPAQEILRKNDGSARLAEMEDMYDLYIKVKCKGNITDKGYFVNGNSQISTGNEIKLQSNNVMTGSVVYEVSEK